MAIAVLVAADDDGDPDTGQITELVPRKNYVLRQSPRRLHDVHMLAANVDQAVLVTTVVEPMLKQGLIDRFLLSTEPYDIPTAIIFNKADRYDEGDRDVFAQLYEIYSSIGYEIFLVSALSGEKYGSTHVLLC